MSIVIFDMDGTLVDSAFDLTSAINLVRSELGLQALDVSTVVEAINGDHANLAKIFYDTALYEQDHRDLFERYYEKECLKNVYLYEGVYELLESLQNKQVRCSVATNAPSSFAKRILRHVGVDHFFDYIYGSDTHQSKPHPDMLHSILRNYSYDSEQNVLSFMVGDSVKDIEAGKNADIKSIHIRWGFSKEKYHNSINSPKELLKLLDIN